jgi:hypothetical protein
MIRKNRLLNVLVVSLALVVIGAAVADAQGYYDTYNWSVQNYLGVGTDNPQAPLEVNFGATGSIRGGTPLGNGPGWIFFAPNGRRRDITAWIDGLYLGASSDSGAAPGTLDICDNGNVGIGYAECPRNIFAVVRGSRTDPIADGWTTYSSRTYKTDIQELTPGDYAKALREVIDTPLVRFRYKEDPPTAKLKLGVVAEEAPAIILAEGDQRAVSLNEYISLLHAAIKAQQTQIEAQEQQIEQLQATVIQITKTTSEK